MSDLNSEKILFASAGFRCKLFLLFIFFAQMSHHWRCFWGCSSSFRSASTSSSSRSSWQLGTWSTGSPRRRGSTSSPAWPCLETERVGRLGWGRESNPRRWSSKASVASSWVGETSPGRRVEPWWFSETSFRWCSTNSDVKKLGNLNVTLKAPSPSSLRQLLKIGLVT